MASHIYLVSFFQISQRPLKTIAKRSGDVYIPRGVSVPALDKDCPWEFQPNDFGIFFLRHVFLCGIVRMVFFLMSTEFDLVSVEGDTITGGDLYAVSLLSSLF